jgi:hypothetical protein
VVRRGPGLWPPARGHGRLVLSGLVPLGLVPSGPVLSGLVPLGPVLSGLVPLGLVRLGPAQLRTAQIRLNWAVTQPVPAR